MDRPVRLFEAAAIALVIGLSLLIHIQFIQTFNINWDEFFYLHHVYEYQSGDLALALQTLHVHAFGWLPAVSTNEADQVVAARVVMLVLHGASAYFLYRITRRATERQSAIFAALAYLCVSHVIRGGASFRADPIAIFLILAAFDLVYMRDHGIGRAAAAGALFGLASMVTIKSTLFIPSFLFIVGLPVLARGRRALGASGLAAWLLAAGGTFALVYWLHHQSLGSPPARIAGATAAHSFNKVLRDAGFFPRFWEFLDTLVVDFVFWGFLLAGGWITAQRVVTTRGAERLVWLGVAALSAPLGSLLIFRNSYPYFYSFMLPTVTVLVAVAWQALDTGRLARQLRIRPAALQTLAVLQLLSVLLVQGLVVPREKPLRHQRAVLDVIHRAFPEPVPYFDRGSIVASFPQVGFFMSTWGNDVYRKRDIHVFAQGIANHSPPLLVADHPLLDIDHQVDFSEGFEPGQALFSADLAALEAAYIHHWGPIYVAGLEITLQNSGGAEKVDVLIPGQYTLEAIEPVQIDGRRFRPGETIELTKGRHELVAETVPLSVTLRWGNHLYKPVTPAPELPLFLGF